MRASTIKPRLRYCLDTGPLFDHFLLSFFGGKPESIPRGPDGKLSDLSDQALWEQFKKLLRRSKGLVTCPGVLVEIDKMFRTSSANKELYGSFLEFVQKQVKEGIRIDEKSSVRIEESFIPWERLRTDELKKFGSVDSSLLALLRNERETRLVTRDGELYQWCGQQRLSCIHVRDLFGYDM